MTTDFENLRAHAQRSDKTNAHLARRVQELEKALDKDADDIALLRNFFEIQSKQYADKQISAEEDAARLRAQLNAEQEVSHSALARVAALRAALEDVEWHGSDNGWLNCPWCRGREHTGHAPDCQRQAALAQTSEVKT